MLWSLENYVDLFCKEIYMKISVMNLHVDIRA